MSRTMVILPPLLAMSEDKIGSFLYLPWLRSLRRQVVMCEVMEGIHQWHQGHANRPIINWISFSKCDIRPS